MSRNIFVVGSMRSYSNWMEGDLVADLESADLVLFTGGEDVTPALYNDPQHPTTCNNIARDKVEQFYFKRAVELNKHIIGICRGSQLACALSGGKLVQDQDNPFSLHPIRTYDNNSLVVTSSHHQAAWPWNMVEGEDFKLLGWTVGISKYHEDGYEKDLPCQRECEIVYYPKTKALGIQSHPEWQLGDSRFVNEIAWFRNLLNLHLENKL